MRKLIVAAFLVAMPFVASADDELPGTYRLISSTRKILDTGEEVKDTYGKHPSGSVMYGKDGRFLVLVVTMRDQTQRVSTRRRISSAPICFARCLLMAGRTSLMGKA